jgi:hypothetical protein
MPDFWPVSDYRLGSRLSVSITALQLMSSAPHTRNKQQATYSSQKKLACSDRRFQQIKLRF